ncbi:hypothetical protein [Pseudoalteromonas piscicida]|uniref:hypothetical protein n=1 Tax=Pseudoalteromonas piscicida TaxID=43662 RepID=UPI0030ACE6A8
MKIKILIILFLLPFVANAENYAFIGSSYSVSQSDGLCERLFSKQGDEIICTSVGFELKYDVIEWIFNPQKGDEFIFYGFYHYTGLPSYTAYPYALVVVEKRNSIFVMQQIKPILDNNSEDWMVCSTDAAMDSSECALPMPVKEYIQSVVNEI